MKIFEAINSIMSEIGVIGKEKVNQTQGFKYRGIDDVMNALQPLLSKHRVFIVPEIIEQRREERTSAKGSLLMYSICTVKYTFYADDGSNVSAVVIGEGMDSGDKATNKAMAIAMKYACFQVFCIATEEMKDPDNESHELHPADKREPSATTAQQSDLISKPQANRIFALSGANADICKEVLKTFGYNKSDEVKKKHYDAICKAVQELAAEPHPADFENVPWK